MKNKIKFIICALSPYFLFNCTDLEEERLDEAAFGAQAETMDIFHGLGDTQITMVYS